MGSITNWLPFSCDEIREQLLLAAPKSFKKRRKREGECKRFTYVAAAAVLSEPEGIFALKEEEQIIS